jgi:tight adherence protein B
MLVSALAVLSGILIFCCILLLKNLSDAKHQKNIDRIMGAEIKTPALRKAAARVDIGKKLKSTGADRPYKKGGLRDLIQQAGFKTSLPKYWTYAVITSLVVMFFCFLFKTAPIVMILFGLTGLLGLPKMYLKFKAKRRQKKFLIDFPDALDAMVRLLKAGMPVTEAIAMAGREFTGPVGEEMSYLYDQQRVGVSLAEASERVAIHMPIPEAQMFATALAIQSETGASLSEVLTNLSGVIRARFRLKRKVVALSSEARTSAMIIGALPITVGLLLKIVNPEYMSLLFEDRTGNVLLWGCGIWMSIGILVMRQMINFRV